MPCRSGVPVHCHVQTLLVPSGGKSHLEIDFPPGASHHTCAGHLVGLGDSKSHVVHSAVHNPTELKHELAGAVLPVGDHHVAISCDDTTLKHFCQPPTSYFCTFEGFEESPKHPFVV